MAGMGSEDPNNLHLQTVNHAVTELLIWGYIREADQQNQCSTPKCLIEYIAEKYTAPPVFTGYMNKKDGFVAYAKKDPRKCSVFNAIDQETLTLYACHWAEQNKKTTWEIQITNDSQFTRSANSAINGIHFGIITGTKFMQSNNYAYAVQERLGSMNPFMDRDCYGICSDGRKFDKYMGTWEIFGPCFQLNDTIKIILDGINQKLLFKVNNKCYGVGAAYRWLARTRYRLCIFFESATPCKVLYKNYFSADTCV